MDQERFDELARGLVSGATRRGMLRNLTGAALGGILVAVGVSEAETRKKKRGGKRKRRRSQCASCGDGCPGDPENNPTKTVAFTPSSDSNFCVVTANLTGFAGCTAYTAEYWSAINPSGTKPKYYGDVTLGPTDLAGSSQTNLGIFGKGGYLDIRFLGDASDFQWLVDC